MSSRRINFGRYNPRMLQLRNEECFPSRFYSRKIRYCRLSTLSSTMCSNALQQGYELGYFKVAASHRGSLVSPLVGLRTIGARANASTPLVSSANWKVGGTMEGERQCHRGRFGKGRQH